MKQILLLPICVLVVFASIKSRADDDAQVQTPPITLKMDSVPPRDVLAELSKQSGVNITVSPENLWDQNYGNNGPAKSITVDMSAKPFWVVMEDIRKESNVRPANTGNNDGVTLQWQGGTAGTSLFGKKPTYVGERATCVADSLQRNHTINLDADDPQPSRQCGITIEAFVDPRLRVSRYQSTPTIERAEDENAQSILPASSDQQNSSTQQTNCSWQIGGSFVPLDYDPQRSHKLALIKGAFHVVAATAIEKLDIDDLSKGEGTEQTVAGRRIVIEELKLDEKSLSLKVTIYREDVNTEDWQNMFQSIYQNLKIENAEGKRSSMGGGGGGDDKKVTYTFSTNWSEDKDKPVKILWEIPTKFVEVELPFEFKDLTLP